MLKEAAASNAAIMQELRASSDQNKKLVSSLASGASAGSSKETDLAQLVAKLQRKELTPGE